jgi:hypothetical protein
MKLLGWTRFRELSNSFTQQNSSLTQLPYLLVRGFSFPYKESQMHPPAFQKIDVGQILDPQTAEDHPAYWLAQLRKADWRELLKFVPVTVPAPRKKRELAEMALARFEFTTCDGRSEVWQAWTSMRHNNQRGVVIQFRHSEKDWSRGVPEFVDLEENEPLGKVNIAGRLLCKVK